MNKDIIFKIDEFFKSINVDEANLTIKDNTEQDNQGFYYCNLDDNEFQFGEEGSIATNYKSIK